MIERHASVWERRRHNWSVGLAAAARVGLAEARLLLGSRRERFDAVIVGYPGHFDLPAARRIARRPAGHLQPARLAPRDPRRGPRPLRGRPRLPRSVLRWIDRIALRRADLVVADTDAERAPPRRARRAARGTAGRLLRRRGGAALPAGVAAGGALPRALRRQADPAPRARDDPGGRAPRARDPVSRRRQRPARRAPRRAPAERRVDRLGRLRAAAGGEPARRLCARRVRHLGEGRPRDPEQGLPGARVRDAARHRRHAGGARAAARRRERAARPARRSRSAGGGRAPARRRSGARAHGSAPAGSRPTASRRARPSSARAGSVSSSGVVGDGSDAGRRRLGRRRRLRRRLRNDRRAPAPRLRERPLRPRQHDAGGLVDRPRRRALGHGRARRADLAARLALRPDPRPARAALVALAGPRAAARRPGGRRRLRGAAGLLARAQAPRRGLAGGCARRSPTCSRRRCSG